MAAWEGNGTFDDFVGFGWEATGGERLVVVVNYSPHRSQCYLRLPFDDLSNKSWRLQDQLGVEVYERDGNQLQAQGLYLDMGPWQAAVYSFRAD